jgi:hypothetical protein
MAGETDAVVALVLAVLCCALPVLLVAGVSIGLGAVLGTAVPVLVGLAVVAYVVAQVLHRWQRSAAGRRPRPPAGTAEAVGAAHRGSAHGRVPRSGGTDAGRVARRLPGAPAGERGRVDGHG